MDSDRSYDGHGRESIPAAPDRASDQAGEPAELASAMGNRAFTDLVTGGGLLAGGAVHPAVEQTIARTRGGGIPLSSGTQEQFAEPLGDSLADVRVHTDATAADLSDAVSARAFTTGSDVYFAQGEYRPGSAEGDRLLAHELTHVVQQRGAPVTGPMVVSQPGDAFETEAEAGAGELAG